jgi:hypothetical protein
MALREDSLHPSSDTSPLLPRSDLVAGTTILGITPLPWGQLGIVFLLQMAEALATTTISPFAPQVWTLLPNAFEA